MQLTPLMICAFRGAEGVDIARILLRAGAGVETADSSPSQSRPLFMAAQQGNTELVQLLLEHSARLDVTSPGSTTTPIWIAAQNGHAPTLARLLEGAQRASLLTPLIDATNRQSKTPANIAIELGHADVIGVLARCGADLRRASPAFYGLRDSEAQRVDHFTVTPSSPGHFALDAAARSFAAKQCCHCGAPVPGCSRCSRCALAYYCGRECQLANWPSHKGVCPKLRRGASLVSPDVIPAVAEPPWASLPPFGFDEPFGAADEASDIHHSQYSRDTSAVWEYDAGGARSQPEWRRYPARIEGALGSMCVWQSSGSHSPSPLRAVHCAHCGACIAGAWASRKAKSSCTGRTTPTTTACTRRTIDRDSRHRAWPPASSSLPT